MTYLTLFVIASFASLTLSQDDCFPVTVHRNGETEGFASSLCASHFSSGNSLDSSLVSEWSSLLDLPTTAERVVLGNGENLTSWTQVSHEMTVGTVDPDSPYRRLYLILPGIHFIWPFVRYGYTISTSVTYFDSSLPASDPSNVLSQPVILQSLSDKPRVLRILSFFTKGEAEGLIETTENIQDEDLKLQRSSVGVNKKNNKRVYSLVRTSKNAFDSATPIALSLIHRCFSILKMPYNEDQADGLQILRYGPGEAYISHLDGMDASDDINFNFDGSRGGSNRFATIFMYLRAPEEGGQTAFRLAENPHPDLIAGAPPSIADEVLEAGSWQRELADDCYTKLAVKPVNVTAVLFYSQVGDGSQDPYSEHGACPPLKGVKWGANLWVWNRRRHGLDRPPANQITLTFRNSAPVPVELLWDGNVLATLSPGESTVFVTYLTHQWTARKVGSDKCGWVYEVREEDDEGVVEIQIGEDKSVGAKEDL